MRTLIITFGAHLDNPRLSSHLQILNLITSAKSLLPYKVTFKGSWDSNRDFLGRGPLFILHSQPGPLLSTHYPRLGVLTFAMEEGSAASLPSHFHRKERTVTPSKRFEELPGLVS